MESFLGRELFYEAIHKIKRFCFIWLRIQRNERKQQEKLLSSMHEQEPLAPNICMLVLVKFLQSARHPCFEIQRQESKNSHSLNNFDPITNTLQFTGTVEGDCFQLYSKVFFFLTSNIPVRKFIPHSIHVIFSTPMPEVFLNVPEKHRNPALLKRKHAKSARKCLNSKNQTMKRQ